MEVIRTDSLTRRFGNTHAVEDVSMRIHEGEIYGFLGLNGAGKSTTIRMLLGMIKPTEGCGYLFGKRVGSEQIDWNNVGYMVEGASAYPNLSVRENLEVTHRYRGLAAKENIDEILGTLKLGDYGHVRSENLSVGNLQRLGLAKALLHKPRLLLLDEPVNGLDPDGIVEIRNMLKELAAAGSTVFISSHILSEIAVLATRIGVIHQGRLLKEHSTKELDSLRIRKLVVNTLNNIETKRFLDQRTINATITSTGRIEVTDQNLIERPEELNAMLVMGSLPPKEIYVHEESLEDYFLRIVHSPA
jgi:ABC-2 type transport system ATP-binding protein